MGAEKYNCSEHGETDDIGKSCFSDRALSLNRHLTTSPEIPRTTSPSVCPLASHVLTDSLSYSRQSQTSMRRPQECNPQIRRCNVSQRSRRSYLGTRSHHFLDSVYLPRSSHQKRNQVQTQCRYYQLRLGRNESSGT